MTATARPGRDTSRKATDAPAASPGTPGSPARVPLTADERAARVRFRRAVTLMVMTLLAPGSAQLVAGSKRVGRFALRVFGVVLLLGLLALAVALVWRGAVLWFVSSTTALGLLRTALIVLAVGWGLLFLDAWRLGRPLSLRQQHRVAVVGVNGALCFTVVGALLFSAHLVGVQRDFVATMFGEGNTSPAHDGRYNVLLMGGDSGQGRWGLRVDSVTLASIDARTGETVLVSLPRNLSDFRFADGSVMARQFPDGFDCDGCHLNGVTTWAKEHPALFEGVEDPGLEATVSAVEGVTGLQVNYWAMVNMQGFTELVDAVGGVTLTVRDPIPVGGLGEDVTGYIEPGTRELDGHDTLWFARARAGSDDYSRMARQKCVMNALLQQVSPQTAIRNVQEIADAGSAMVATNLPRGEVDRFLGLALEARQHPLETVSLVPPRVDTSDPDMDTVHAMISRAVEGSDESGSSGDSGDSTLAAGGGGRSGGGASEGSDDAAGPRSDVGTTGGSLGSLGEGYLANQAENLGATC